MKALELTNATFDETLSGTDLPVLVDFHAEWCGPCKMMGPVIEQIAGEQTGQAIVAKVDIDQAPEIARRFGITSIPTLIAFAKGEAVATVRGVQGKPALLAMIAKAQAAVAG